MVQPNSKNKLAFQQKAMSERKESQYKRENLVDVKALGTVQFGATGLPITRIGFGAWALGGGGWQFGWGDQDDRESVEAIHHAIEAGINWIDTAAAYGFGRSERVIGEALKGIEPERRPYVFTKCSLLNDGHQQIAHCLKRDSIRREIDGSLERLGLESIDLYQVHWPIPESDIAEAWETLVELKEQGRVRHIGVSNFSVQQMKKVQSIAPIESLQPPYSLLTREVEEEILPFARQNNIGVIVYSPMYSGLLTGSMTPERIANFPADDWRRRDPEFHEPRLSNNLKLVERLKKVASRHRTSVGAVAVAWTLHNPAVTGAIVGFRKVEQVEPILPGSELQLTEEDIKLIEN